MKNPGNCKSIEEIRKGIDQIDFQIMKLFHERHLYVKEIVKYKTDKASVIAENRQEEVIAQRRAWAADLELKPDLFENIYKALIRSNIQEELEMLKKSSINQI